MPEPRVVEFMVPLPPKELHPNSRVHWGAKIAPKRTYRLRIRAIFAGIAPMERATLELTYVYATRRTRDDDNLTGWFKAGRDGLVDAGVVPGDGPEHLTIIAPITRVEKGATPHVIVRLTERLEE